MAEERVKIDHQYSVLAQDLWDLFIEVEFQHSRSPAFRQSCSPGVQKLLAVLRKQIQTPFRENGPILDPDSLKLKEEKEDGKHSKSRESTEETPDQ